MNVSIATSLDPNSICLKVLRMREKVISSMMSVVHRRDTDVEEREERISHLMKVLASQLTLCARVCV